MSQRRFELVAAALAAMLLASAGKLIWGSKSAPTQGVREVHVAWRCQRGDDEDCRVVSEVERCTTCHEATTHAERATLIDRHAFVGCVACHGGDGIATERSSAHHGLAALGTGDAVPEVQARCAACHADTRGTKPSPAKAAWARWLATRERRPAAEAAAPAAATEHAPALASGRRLFRSLRCGACHEARDRSPIATPLAVLGLRSTPSELATALREHAARTHIDLGLDETTAAAVATHLVAIESPDESTAIVHRASAPGSSAEDGKVLYERLACAACHDTSAQDEARLAVDLSGVATSRTADWLAYYLSDPARANPAATMPSLRLTAREAASLASYLEGKRGSATFEPRGAGAETIACKLPDGSTQTIARDACGEAVIAAAKCGACHAETPSPGGPSLARFGDSHDGKSAIDKLAAHAALSLDANARRDLAAYLLSQRSLRVRPDLRAFANAGQDVFFSRGCAGCHALDDLDAKRAGPSLFGEGLRTQPQWLFSFLRAPELHPVRPSLHPELAYRDLVAPDRTEPRMPTYALSEAETTSLVRFFDERDGASFPYAATPRVALAGDSLTEAVGDLGRKDRGACTSCHTVAMPDVARARDEGPRLAPPLALAHERLRPAWIEACIAQPNTWVRGMPAFERSQDDVDRVRDLVLLLRERTVLPPPGQESVVPALGLGDFP